MVRPYETYRTHRRSRRLRGYDYAQPAAYFVTVCTHDRVCHFGTVRDGVMHLTEIGQAASEEWQRTEDRRPEIVLDAFVVMPNHLHGIVLIMPPDVDPTIDPRDARGYHVTLAVASTRGSTLRGRWRPHRGQSTHRARMPVPSGFSPKSLGSCVAGFKSAATKRINIVRGTPGAQLWQRGYHDRILRNEREWIACRRYIELNPARWEKDKHNPNRR